jgi:hypothetical protein
MADYLGTIHHCTFGHGTMASVPTLRSYHIQIPAGQAGTTIIVSAYAQRVKSHEEIR